MELKQLSKILLLTSSVWLWSAMNATAQEAPNSSIVTRYLSLEEFPDSMTNDQGKISDLNQPATTVANWITQIEASPVQITGVQIKTTEVGLQVVLETVEGELTAPTIETVGNALIIEIPNAVEEEGFEQFEPAEGIAFVGVTGLLDNRVQVSVTGTDALPEVQVRTEAGNLLLSVVPGTTRADDADADETIDIVVTGQQDTGYYVPNATTGTRTDTPIRDIPQSIQVVPQQVIRDQQATRVEDALRNVPSVVQESAIYSSVTNFTIRGFSARNSGNILRDGLFDGLGSVTGSTVGTDLFNIDRVEVLLGPASVLYGAAAPGGTINLVTKQPLRDPFYQVDATIGNYAFYRGNVDLSGPLNDSRSVLYRLNAGYENSGSFIDFFDRESLSISPIVSFRLGDRTEIFVEGEYASIDTTGYNGLPSLGTVLPNPNGEIPRNSNYGEPGDFNRTTNSRIGYRLEHQFNDNWSLRNAFRVKFSTYDVDVILPISMEADNRTLNRLQEINEGDGTNYVLATNLIGNFLTGSIGHQLLVGVDWNRDNATFLRAFTSGVSPIDAFNPVYNRLQTEPFQINFSDAYETNSLGIYVQDLVSLTENLKLLLGLRYDTQDYNIRSRVDDFTYSQSDSAFSPRVGIVYQPIEPISLYASYARSFTPSLFGNAFDGSPFEPERGTQYEVGVKADLNDQLSATLAFYSLTRTNVPTDDPDNIGFSIQTGEQRSRGVEFNVGGEILPGWNVIAGYAYTDAQITQDNIFPVGNRLNNVPENSFNFWTTYQIQQGGLQGFGFGLGLFYIGDLAKQI